MALWQFTLFIYFTSIHNPVAWSRFYLCKSALAPVASHRHERQRWPSCLQGWPLDSTLPYFAQFYKLHKQHFYYRHERFSILLHRDIRKHFLIFSFNLSLMNSIWTNFKKINKRGKNMCFWWVRAFLLSAQRDLPANLMKSLYQGNFFKQMKKSRF